ncbi:MAG: hypothetical protein ACRCW1_06190 [Anaerotignaceae bacterium]
MMEAIESVSEIGIAIVLVLIMTKYFLSTNKNLALQNENLYKQFVADSAQREEQYRNDIKRKDREYRERENLLVAETTRREEILKQESQKREQLLKSEAAKREASLISTIEGFSLTMEKISQTMEDMKYKIGGIENTLEKTNGGDSVGAKNGG